MSLTFREYVILEACLNEDGTLDEGAIWDKIVSMAKTAVGGSKSKADLEAEKAELIAKFGGPDGEKKIADAVRNKSIDLVQAAKIRAANREQARLKKEKDRLHSSGLDGESDEVKADRERVYNTQSRTARAKNAMDRSARMQHASQNAPEGDVLAEGRQEYVITYKTKVGNKVMKDVVSARDVRDVRRKFSDDYHGMRLLTIAPKKAPRDSKRDEPEEMDEEFGPLGPRRTLGEGYKKKLADELSISGWISLLKDVEELTDEELGDRRYIQDRVETIAGNDDVEVDAKAIATEIFNRMNESLNEAKAEMKTVVMKVSYDYITNREDEAQGSATLFWTCKSAEEAQALLAKIKATQDEGLMDDGGDMIYHWGQNSYNNFQGAHGDAIYIEDAKLASKEPALSRKVYGFNPADFDELK